MIQFPYTHLSMSTPAWSDASTRVSSDR